MALPVTIPNTFANATASIPLSQLDTNFNTLANAVNGISDGSETLANASVTVLTAGTVDINGGAIDGTTVGTSNAAAGSFTTLNTSGAVVFNDAGADVDFRVEGDTNANLLFVDASADAIGIGTSSPVSQLHVYPSTANVFTEGLRVNRQGQTGQYAIFNYSAGIGRFVAVDSLFNAPALGFFTSSDGSTQTERMRITSGGDLCIGTTSAQASSRLSVVKASSDYVMYVQNTNGSSGDKTYRSILGANTNNTNSFHFSGSAASGDRIYIYGNGDIVNSNNSYGSLSDIKLKQDIIDANSQWNDIKNIRVRKFRFKTDPTGPLQIGVVAQELEEVSPGLVQESTDYEEVTKTREVEKTRVVTEAVLDEDGNEIEPAVTETYTEEEEYTERVALDTTTKSVKYSVLYMKAVKALQEAMERIETLEAKVAALENA